MKGSTEKVVTTYENAIVQIATPYSTGTGFILSNHGVIVTNEHVVRDNKQVVVTGPKIEKQLAKVVFLSIDHDLAFLYVEDLPEVSDIKIYEGEMINVGAEVIAVGHPFGLEFSVTKGIVSSVDYKVSNINYIQHDAALNPGNSGGPLITSDGYIIGVNTFIMKNGNNIGFSLPWHILSKAAIAYDSHMGTLAIQCTSCDNLVFESKKLNHCEHCGSALTFISEINEYEPQGVNKTLESMISNMGHNVQLSRTGPSCWSIKEGSAKINITYHEKSGLITGDAHLCELPKEHILAIYQYLLRENYSLEGLTFSVKDKDIILSLLIFDQYFNQETAQIFFQKLFSSADYYDNILVENFGARWDSESDN